MGRHETGRHSPFSSEGRTDPPLDRTVVGHGTVHGPAMARSDPVHGHGPVRDGLDRPIHFKPLPLTGLGFQGIFSDNWKNCREGLGQA
jgi:hypothetical protein